MIDLLNNVKAKLEELLAGTAYQLPEGGAREPRVEIGALPPKRTTAGQGEDFPFVVIRPLSGSDGRRETLLTLRLILGIYNQDIVGGIADLHDLGERCRQLQNQRGVFSPWTLQNAATWQDGSDREGNQPHPYYNQTIDFQLKHPPRTAG